MIVALRKRSTVIAVVTVVAATLAVLTLSFALELGGCRHHGCTAGLGDVPGRYVADGIRPSALPYVDRVVEYPVLVGGAMWVGSLAAHNPHDFLVVTSIGSVALAVGLVLLLRRRAGVRIWHLVLAPPLLLYALHNWDLLAVVPAVAGLLAFERGADGAAGALLAVGASAKVFPGLFIPPLAALRAARDRGRAKRFVGAAILTTVALNLPVLLASPSGWWFPAKFQGHRAATWGTVWYWLFRFPIVRAVVDPRDPGLANVVSMLALGAGLVALCVLAYRRRPSPVALAAAATALFMLTNKVYSPNYDLWIVPFFALMAFPTWVRRGFGTASVAMFVLVFGMFHGLVPREATLIMLPVVVAARAVMLGAILVIATRAPAGARETQSRSAAGRTRYSATSSP